MPNRVGRCPPKTLVSLSREPVKGVRTHSQTLKLKNCQENRADQAPISTTHGKVASGASPPCCSWTEIWSWSFTRTVIWSVRHAGQNESGPALRRRPALLARCRGLFVEPERVEAHAVVDAEIFVRIVALHVVVPDVVDVLPGDRQHRRILLHDHLGVADQGETLLRVDLGVDLGQQGIELVVAPEAVILRTVLLVPGVEVVRRVEQGRDHGADREIEVAGLDVVE